MTCQVAHAASQHLICQIAYNETITVQYIVVGSSVLLYARLGLQHTLHLFSTAWQECRKKNARGTCCVCGSRQSKAGHCQSSLQTDTVLLRLETGVVFTALMKVRMSHWTHISDTSVSAITIQFERCDVCMPLHDAFERHNT